MKKRLVKMFLGAAMTVSMLSAALLPVSAMNDTTTRDCYVSGGKTFVGTVESRIWAATGAKFDATSSSWVFKKPSNIYIRNHQNTLTLKSGGLGVSISCPYGGVSYSNGGKTAIMATGSVSGYDATYRGINSYGNSVNGVGWWVNCYSDQSLQLDGQQFNCSASVFKGL
ncbi:hypothetical protein [Candidatus Galacturonibacter soehngenii]|uniref:Uncharacterized protein n=1 Tax=Candidatus Galacturonatibacter soehngenii TaxID=2307010 RepID=A0A7V7QI70_9FIRM|nr:hypothetical protein [Candidatus Galacturonibacter soehngenii]KAB1435857.1 hypothetical protein F7O84_15890 [Candidatus Galacturonibacter soehngenii]MBA4686600.1 hypothetical protein [Candidatus Galacturonibacter soehngenii]